MKKRTTSIVLMWLASVCLFNIGSAQITLTFAHVPKIGDVYYSQPLDTTIQQGSSGANITWDFSAARDSVSGGTIKYIDPAATHYASSFPGATVADSISGFDYFYEANSSSFSYLGLRGAAAFNSFKYTNAEVLMQFPFTYLNKFNDTFSGQNLSGAIVKRMGSDSAVADAYGTLKLPGGVTYKNVLRVMFKEIFTDSSSGKPTYSYSTTTNYSWYDSIHLVPVFSVIYTQSTGNIVSESKLVTWNKFDTTTGLQEFSPEEFDVKLFPNPVKNDLLKMSFILQNPSDVVISFFNVVGQQISSRMLKEQSVGMHTEVFPLDNLSKGIYTIRIQTAHSFTCKKMVIE